MLRRVLVVSSIVVSVVAVAGCSVRQDGELALQLDGQSPSVVAAAGGGEAQQTPAAREPLSAEDVGKQVVIDPLSPGGSSSTQASAMSTPVETTEAAEPPTVTVTEVPSSGPATDANGNELVTPPAAPMGVAGPGQVVPINEIGGTYTAQCDGGEVQIAGVDNTVTITGHCSKLTISGVDNVVVVDSFDELDLSGVRNHVTYLQGEYTGEPGGIDCVVVKG